MGDMLHADMLHSKYKQTLECKVLLRLSDPLRCRNPTSPLTSGFTVSETYTIRATNRVTHATAPGTSLPEEGRRVAVPVQLNLRKMMVGECGWGRAQLTI